MGKGYMLLAAAIFLEIVSTSMLKASCGFTKWMPGLAFIVGMGASFYIFSKALLILPLGMAYAIWFGVGTAATALVAVFIWKEPMTMPMIAGIALIVGGVWLLNLKTIGG